MIEFKRKRIFNYNIIIIIIIIIKERELENKIKNWKNLFFTNILKLKNS